MKAFYLHNQKIGDNRFEVVARDAHQYLPFPYETTEYRLIIQNGHHQRHI